MGRKRLSATTSEPESRELTAEQLHKLYLAAPYNVQEAVKELLTEWVCTTKYSLSVAKTYLYHFENEHARSVTIKQGEDIPPDLRRLLKQDYEDFFAAELKAERQDDTYLTEEINQILQGVRSDISEALARRDIQKKIDAKIAAEADADAEDGDNG